MSCPSLRAIVNKFTPKYKVLIRPDCSYHANSLTLAEDLPTRQERGH